MVTIDGNDWQIGYKGVCTYCGCEIECVDIVDDVDYEYDEFDNAIPYGVRLPKFKHTGRIKGSCAECKTGAYPKGGPTETIAISVEDFEDSITLDFDRFEGL